MVGACEINGHTSLASCPSFFFYVLWVKALARLVSKVADPSALPGVFRSLAGQSFMESLERKAQVLFLSVCMYVYHQVRNLKLAKRPL